VLFGRNTVCNKHKCARYRSASKMNESRGQAARLEQSHWAVIELSSRAVHMNSKWIQTSSCAFVTQKAKWARQYVSSLGSSISDFLTGKSMPQAKNLLPKIMDQEARFQHWWLLAMAFSNLSVPLDTPEFYNLSNNFINRKRYFRPTPQWKADFGLRAEAC